MHSFSHKLLFSLFVAFLVSVSLLTLPTYAATDCAELLQGSCQNVSQPCAGIYVPGHCSGDNNTQCCTPKKGIQSSGGFLQAFGGQAGFPEEARPPEIVIGEIIQGAIVVVGVVFGILIVYGGYLWMVARGNEEIVKKSIGILKTAIIGFIIVVAAYAITTFVVERVIGAAYQPR